MNQNITKVPCIKLLKKEIRNERKVSSFKNYWFIGEIFFPLKNWRAAVEKISYKSEKKIPIKKLSCFYAKQNNCSDNLWEKICQKKIEKKEIALAVEIKKSKDIITQLFHTKRIY